jgi:integrase
VLKTRTDTKRLHLTSKRIDAIPVPKQRTTLYDAKTQALGLKIEPKSGVKTFFWFRAVPETGQTSGAGKPTWRTIGPWPDISLEAARDKAEEYNVTLANWRKDGCRGPNPFRTEQKTELTLADLLDAYVTKHLLHHAKRPDKADKDARWQIKKYLSEWKPRALATITRDDVTALHERLGKGGHHRTANRTVQLLRRMFNWARDENHWRGENPAARIKLYREKKRERFFQPDEMLRLYKALDATKNTMARDFFTLSLETAARCGDIAAMQWHEINWTLSTWTIPDPKNQHPQTVELNRAAVAVLRRRYAARKESANPWAFPSRSKSGHLQDAKNAWKKICKAAGLVNATIHDLRRTRASYMALSGSSLLQIGAVLGHRDPQSTAIYARLNQQAQREAQAAGEKKMRVLMTAAKKQLSAGT